MRILTTKKTISTFGLFLAALTMGATLVFASPVWAAEEVFGLEKAFEGVIENQDKSSAIQAGSHPYALTTTIVFNHEVTSEQERHIEDSFTEEEFALKEPTVNARIYGNPKNLEVNLPPGLVVNPSATAVKCTEAQLEETPGAGGGCPDASAVGIDYPAIAGFGEQLHSAVYNMVPPPGVPAELGISPAGQGFVIHIIGKLRTGGDYGLSGAVASITQKVKLYGVKLTLWGNPSDASHDTQRGICSTYGAVQKAVEEKEFEEENIKHGKAGQEFRFDCPLPNSERTNKPFLSMPGACTGKALQTSLTNVFSWQDPNSPLPSSSATSPAVEGCAKLNFNPSLKVTPAPEGMGTESPSGLDVDLKVPQEESVEGRAEANLKEAVVRLPAGMTVSPSATNGLGACSEEQIGLNNANSPSCPDSSKVGSVEIETPLLEKPLKGSVFLGQQGNLLGNGSNPFGSLLALYIVAEGQGALIKLPGEVALDPVTGQLTARFGKDPVRSLATGEEQFLPQLPFSDLKMGFYGGPKAPLITPSACGTYTTTSQLFPWSGAPPAEPQSSFTINAGCGAPGFSPSFTAGTTNNQAGAFSPFSVALSRQDREQRLSSVQVTTPPGLLGVLRSVVQCPEPQASQESLGACGPASLIGETTVAVGPGEDPFWVKGGAVYLTGPYKGAPFGLKIVVPAVAGPFNLGNKGNPVVVRAQVNVDPHTAQITVTSDPLPTILQGVPLDERTINVTINRTGFMFNPTNCAPLSVTGVIGSTSGASAAVSSPFQAANCANLPFKPSFKVSTQASTSKAKGASLAVKVGSGPGQANIGKVRVILPKQLPARLTTLQKACTEAVFNANPASCPAASVVGTATAVTPELAHPLTGPAYLVSHGGAAFPDLVFVLQGEGILLYLDGNTNIKKGITSSTFNSVPDAPISTFETVLPEGPHSILATNIPAKSKGSMCQQKLAMPTTITGQNGAIVTQTTKIAVNGCPKPKAKKVIGKKKKKK